MCKIHRHFLVMICSFKAHHEASTTRILTWLWVKCCRSGLAASKLQSRRPLEKTASAASPNEPLSICPFAQALESSALRFSDFSTVT